MKKLASVSCLLLLTLHVLGFAFLTFWGEWRANKTVHQGAIAVEEGSLLTLKMSISIPYLTDFERSDNAEELAIYEGNFYKEIKKYYQNDTLYVAYEKVPMGRGDIPTMLNGVFKNLSELTADATDTDTPGSGTSDLLQKLAKFYTTVSTASTWIFFWIDFLPSPTFIFLEGYISPILGCLSPPPLS